MPDAENKCLVCSRPAHLHHRKRKGMGGGSGDDTIPLYWQHHNEAHVIGPTKFHAKYGVVICTKQRWEVLNNRMLVS